MGRVEQLKQKRAGTGVRAHDPERAYQGYTLFTPSAGGDVVYLVDMDGQVAHTWHMPHPPGIYGCLTPQGTLLYNGKVLEPGGTRFIDSGPWKAGSLLEMTWDGDILWEVRHPDHHHDGIRLRNGNVLLLCLASLPDEIARHVVGGMPGSEHEGVMHADYLVEMTTGGKEVWRWNAWEHLDPVEDRIVAVQDHRSEWTHGNAVVEMDDGNIIVSFRNISTIIIERATGEIIWKLGAPPLAQQHAPVVLENGNLLIFDNGTHRLDHPVPFSRVIEVDRATKEIVWTYQEGYLSEFFSPFISNAQRLPNGNTLICEGSFGRIFEVTRDGEVVWEYINPHFHEPVSIPGTTPRNTVFRAFRYGVDEIRVVEK